MSVDSQVGMILNKETVSVNKHAHCTSAF